MRLILFEYLSSTAPMTPHAHGCLQPVALQVAILHQFVRVFRLFMLDHPIPIELPFVAVFSGSLGEASPIHFPVGFG